MQDNASTGRVLERRGGRRWAEHDAQFERTIGPLTAPLLARIAPTAATRALDIGCGCGNQTLALARHLGAGRARHRRRHLRAHAGAGAPRAAAGTRRPVDFLLADASTHRFEPASFDLLFSRFGVMFFADPLAAFRNLHAACAPGARAGVLLLAGAGAERLAPAAAAGRAAPCARAGSDGSARAGPLRLRRPRARHRHPRGGRLRRRAVRRACRRNSASPRAIPSPRPPPRWWRPGR